MRKMLMIATVLAAASTGVQAQTDLTAYADANGYIDVQALTCAALVVYCKANPQVRIIEAIGVMLKQEKLMSGFK